ncbi:MAG: hypothetical protein HC876_19715 [Chloroflexaceae bacterium]|nr:hypothetical protein [Chloroflexaceae bacterium]
MPSLPHRRRNQQPQQEAPDQAVLYTLLQQTPPEHTPLRPVVLRSVAEQRRVALQHYLLRTWVDDTLAHTERLLLLVLLLLPPLWWLAIQGYDWLQAAYLHQPPVTAALAASLEDTALVPVDTSAPPAPALTTPADNATAPAPLQGAEPSLPFVAPATADAPDYIAPRPAVVRIRPLTRARSGWLLRLSV